MFIKYSFWSRDSNLQSQYRISTYSVKQRRLRRGLEESFSFSSFSLLSLSTFSSFFFFNSFSSLSILGRRHSKIRNRDYDSLSTVIEKKMNRRRRRKRK